MTLRQTLKPWAARMGLTSSAILWKPLALRQYEKKRLENPDYREWIDKYQHWLGGHWAHDIQTEAVTVTHLSSQLFEITSILKRRIGFVGNKSVLDAGASDALFMYLLGAKDGTGINILPSCVDKIKSAGFKALQCSIEGLPFPDKSFDIVICCETLEHVLNPLRTLNELARVSKGKIYMTIPWLKRTRLNAKPEGWPETESHIFEFNESDFSKVVTFSDVEIVHKELLQIFPEPSNPLTRWWVDYWLYQDFFPKLQYYELRKK